MKRILLFILIFISLISCGETKEKTELLTEKSQEEIYGEIIKEMESMNTFKYTSYDTYLLPFFEGQSTNTFQTDKKGNAYSNRNGEQIYKVNGKLYVRYFGLRQEGQTAEVTMDTLVESEENKDYFERNIVNVKNFLFNNIKTIEKIPNQKISVSDNKYKLDLTDLKGTLYESLDSIEIYYEPNKEVTYIFNRTDKYEKVKYKVEDKLIFNSDEIIKLPKLMEKGTQLKLIK